MKNLSKDMCGPGGGFRKFKQLPDLGICGLKLGPAARKEKQERAIEKPKIDNARRARGS